MFKRLPNLILLFTTFGLVACATPESVKNLTIEAGDASIALSNDILKFSTNTKNIAEVRATNIAKLKLSWHDAKAVLNQEIKLKKAYREIEEQKKVTLLIEIEKLIEDIIIENDNAFTVATERKKILDDQIAINPPVKSFNDLGVALLKLSTDENILDRIVFTSEFINQVIDDVSKAQDDAEKSKERVENATLKTSSN